MSYTTQFDFKRFTQMVLFPRQGSELIFQVSDIQAQDYCRQMASAMHGIGQFFERMASDCLLSEPAAPEVPPAPKVGFVLTPYHTVDDSDSALLVIDAHGKPFLYQLGLDGSMKPYEPTDIDLTDLSAVIRQLQLQPGSVSKIRFIEKTS